MKQRSTLESNELLSTPTPAQSPNSSSSESKGGVLATPATKEVARLKADPLGADMIDLEALTA